MVISAKVGVARNHNRVAGGQAIRARTGNQSSYGGLVTLVNHLKKNSEMVGERMESLEFQSYDLEIRQGIKECEEHEGQGMPRVSAAWKYRINKDLISEDRLITRGTI